MEKTITPSALPSATDLAVAIRVGQKMLAAYGDPSGFDVFAFAQAHGGLAEALRILLRALDAEPHPKPIPPAVANLHQLCRAENRARGERP